MLENNKQEKTSLLTEIFYLGSKICLKVISFAKARDFHTARLTCSLNSPVLLTSVSLVIQLIFDKSCSLLGN